jgi:hypothetical protein
MKRLLIILAIFFGMVTVSFAQSAYDDIKADPFKAGGEYNMYPEKVPAATPAPKGYKPFYISHFGRHGARYTYSSDAYDNIKKILDEAHSAGKLTVKGEGIRTRFDALYPSIKGRGGDLSQKGQAQQRAIADRMSERYPQVFRHKGRISAVSSVVPRCILTMSAFTIEMGRLHPDMDIRTDTGESFMAFMSPQSETNPAYQKVRLFDKSPQRDSIRKDKSVLLAQCDFPAMMYRIFNDLDYAKSIKSLERLTFDFYYLAVSTNCIDTDESFMDIFTTDEICKLWECPNFDVYSLIGPGKYFGGKQYAICDTLLRVIIHDADKDIADGKTDVRLRFGHDYGIIPLLALMQAGDWGKTVDNPLEVKDFWRNYDVPMASNVQFIFYRNRTGNILVKIMLNEKDMYLPIKSVSGPFYSWDAFRKHCMERVKFAQSLF